MTAGAGGKMAARREKLAPGRLGPGEEPAPGRLGETGN